MMTDSLFDFNTFENELTTAGLKQWVPLLIQAIKAWLARPDGNLPRWRKAVESLIDVKTGDLDFNADIIKIGNGQEIDTAQREHLIEQLKLLSPWRKGPFSLFDIFIDSEWRSELKWNRLADHISPLKDRLVLDVGCGNGYHMFRMAGENARLVLGADPWTLFLAQFAALQKYHCCSRLQLMPIGVEHLPEDMNVFDSVFSMGVFYHRRSPFDFLQQLRQLLRKDGELILETLVIEGNELDVLVPGKRYAQMRNVWFIPSIKAICKWLERAGFTNVRCVNSCETTCEEQRPTEWMTWLSLEHALDAADPTLTIEGYPAPRRAIFVATND